MKELMNRLFKQKFIKIPQVSVILVIIFTLAVGSFVFGQTKSNEKECPDKKKTYKTKTKSKKRNKKTNLTQNNIFTRARVNREVNLNNNKFNFNAKTIQDNFGFTEKTIDVHEKVYVSLCVLRGNIKVNGWNRKEARVFVKGKYRSDIGFKVRQKSVKDKKPVWVQVVGYNTKERVGRNFNVCLSGNIEIDVPKNATIKITNTKGQSETSVDSVRIAYVKVLGGDIYLNNIADKISANTFQGGVTVRNSSGKMDLTTTTGNIVARNTLSHEIGDYFKANTRSGAITLQSVDQKEVNSSSSSGSINYVGSIKPYGKYDFSTNNGSINLAIPSSTSCQVVMAYGGSFQSELPLSDLLKERSGSLVYLRGRMGDGEASLNLKSLYGTIRIREKNSSVLASF